jgi:hypothetical protein
MADPKEGLKSALQISQEQLGELLTMQREEQLTLLPLPAAPDTPAPPVKRGRGRPPGATNKRTTEWADYILARYGSPLEAMASYWARPVAVLAAELGCSAFEAAKLALIAAKESAPYVHSKMPVLVDVEGKGLVNLTINTSSERFGGARSDGKTITITAETVDEKSEGNSDV